MPRYVAFLRAINVGGHVVKMERLRETFESLGLAKVETFIASGSVIFESPKKPLALEKTVERELHRSLGYAVVTFLRTDGQLNEIDNQQPFPGIEFSPAGNVLYVGFVKTTPGDDGVAKLMTFRNEIDDFYVREREFYWLRRREKGESLFSSGRLEKIIGMPATMRNMTTVNRLVAKLNG